MIHLQLFNPSFTCFALVLPTLKGLQSTAGWRYLSLDPLVCSPSLLSWQWHVLMVVRAHWKSTIDNLKVLLTWCQIDKRRRQCFLQNKPSECQKCKYVWVLSSELYCIINLENILCVCCVKYSAELAATKTLCLFIEGLTKMWTFTSPLRFESCFFFTKPVFRRSCSFSSPHINRTSKQLLLCLSLKRFLQVKQKIPMFEFIHSLWKVSLTIPRCSFVISIQWGLVSYV